MPARPPLHGAWPGEMRAETAAAFLDFATTGEFFKAIQRQEAPAPTAYRLRAGRREAVWALESCKAYVAGRHGMSNDGAPPKENIGALV